MFLGHDSTFWTTIGTWLYVLLTGAIAFFAFLAWKSSQRQLKVAETAHAGQLAELKASREASLRPVLVLDRDKIRIVLEFGRPVLQIEMRNVGPGPAMWPAFNVWIRDLAETRPRAAPDVDIGEPAVRLFPFAVAPREMAPVVQVEVPASALGSDGLWVRVDARYSDVFKNMVDDPAHDSHICWFEGWRHHGTAVTATGGSPSA